MTDRTLTPYNGTVERERRRRLSILAARPVKGNSRTLESRGSTIKTKAAGSLLYKAGRRVSVGVGGRGWWR